MNIRKFLLLALSVFSFTPFNGAISAPLISIGDNTDVFFNGSTSLRWTSNLFREEDDEVDDLIWTIRPGFEINVGRGVSNADLSVTTNYTIRRYAEHDELDSELFDIRAIGSYQSSRLDLSGAVGFSQAQSTTGDTSAVVDDDLTKTESYDGNVHAEYRFSPKLSFGLGFKYFEKNYVTNEDFLSDRHTITLPFDLFYELTPKVDLSVGYIYSETDVESSLNTPIAYTTENHFLNVGARGNLLPKVTGFFKVGYSTREDDRPGSEDNSTLGLDADLTWAATPKITARLGLSRGFGVGGEGLSNENTSVDLNVNYSIDSFYAASGFLSYNLRDYDTGREDNQYELGARLTYTPNQYWRFGAGYTFSENDSSQESADYTDHSFDVSVSLRY